jgi:steroid delta-isomerase-like uncharacterized protein
MTPDEHKAIVRGYVDIVFNRKQLDRADEIVAPDFVDHAALPGQASGLAGARKKWAMFHAAIPDLRVMIEDMVAEGDKVAVRRSYQGTQQGQLFGVPPTGRPFQISGYSIFRLVEGKIAEHWELLDRLALMQQLGAIPAPAPPAASAT